MANICEYKLRIKGKPKDVKKMSDILFQYCGTYDFNDYTEYKDKDCRIDVFEGSCRWSVHTSFFDEALEGKTVAILSKETNTTVEIYSKEDGCCFQEHLVIENGEVTLDEGTEWQYICPEDFETVEEFNETFGTEYSEHNWNRIKNEEYIELGGFEWDFDDTQPPKKK